MRHLIGLQRACVAVAIALVGAGQAAAVELQAGGYGTIVQAVQPAGSLSMHSSYPDDAGQAGITMDFTPRASGTLFTRKSEPADLRLSVGVRNSWDSDLRLDTMGLSDGVSGGYGRQSGDENHTMAVGGALLVEDWQISGGFGRTPLLGVDSDVVSAGVSYGPMAARLVYGQVLTEDLERDVVMFSTDLAAWSWLTLQSDVAISETEQQESVAVGRLGVRLHF